MFITLEGPEGSGKTSHVPPLVEYFREKGQVIFPTREPGGTSISEQIREVIHDLKNVEMHPRTETLLYQAARAQIVEQVIQPRLKAGEIVMCDRYADSTIAYQGYGHQQDLAQVRTLVRRLQHEMARNAELVSHSYGKEPRRHVRIFRE